MLSTIEAINSAVNNFIWGVPAMICIIGVGLVLSFRTRFLQIRKFPYAMKVTFGRMFKKREASDGAMTPFQAVCTALAATVGTGNIAGVAGAIAIGGPGAVFLIIKFRGNYHGHSDGLLVKAGSAALTTAVPDSAGVPASYTQNTLVAEYNNKESVRELMEQYGSNVAAIIVEPVAANMGVVPPKEGFLEFLREITLKYETVLIFDEVITGFRLGFGGAQEYFGVKPDMTTLGKIVGGGMPIAAYGGRKEIMDRVSPTGPVYQAGTLSGNPIATTAGIETLKILKAHPEYYKKIDESAKKIADAYRKMAEEKNIPLHVNQIGSLLSAFQTGETVDDYDSALTSDTKAYTEYFWKMLDNGIYVAPAQFEAMFVSVAHTEEDIKRTCEVIGL